MSALSLGLRIAIIFPTILYYFSVIISYVLLNESPKINNDQRLGFFKQFFWESYLLLIGNGLVLIFEFDLTELGILINFLIGGLFVIAGILTIKSESARILLLFFINLIILSELVYFLTLGTSLEIFGYILEPWMFALIPIIIVFILIILAGLTRKKKG